MKVGPDGSRNVRPVVTHVDDITTSLSAGLACSNVDRWNAEKSALTDGYAGVTRDALAVVPGLEIR